MPEPRAAKWQRPKKESNPLETALLRGMEAYWNNEQSQIILSFSAITPSRKPTAVGMAQSVTKEYLEQDIAAEKQKAAQKQFDAVCDFLKMEHSLPVNAIDREAHRITLPAALSVELAEALKLDLPSIAPLDFYTANAPKSWVAQHRSAEPLAVSTFLTQLLDTSPLVNHHKTSNPELRKDALLTLRKHAKTLAPSKDDPILDALLKDTLEAMPPHLGIEPTARAILSEIDAPFHVRVHPIGEPEPGYEIALTQPPDIKAEDWHRRKKALGSLIGSLLDVPQLEKTSAIKLLQKDVPQATQDVLAAYATPAPPQRMI